MGEQTSQTACLRAVLEMGVFDALPADGTSMPAAELAQKLDVEELLLGISFGSLAVSMVPMVT